MALITPAFSALQALALLALLDLLLCQISIGILVRPRNVGGSGMATQGQRRGGGGCTPHTPVDDGFTSIGVEQLPTGL
jgi:hypothetical protein